MLDSPGCHEVYDNPAARRKRLTHVEHDLLGGAESMHPKHVAYKELPNDTLLSQGQPMGVDPQTTQAN